MNGKRKLVGSANIDNQVIPCVGEIEIITNKDKVFYVSWQIFDEMNNRIAGLSKNYFINKETTTNDDIFNLIVTNILKYRMGRKYIFSEIKLLGYP